MNGKAKVDSFETPLESKPTLAGFRSRKRIFFRAGQMMERSNASRSTSHTDSRSDKDTMGRVLVLLIIVVTCSKINDG